MTQLRQLFQTILRHRFGLIAFMVLITLCIGFLTRIILGIYSLNEIQTSLPGYTAAFLVGAFFDVITMLYASMPLMLILILLPNRWMQKPLMQIAMHVVVVMHLIMMLFHANAEILFWDEFNTRFNFIAVDYLVYTTEVLGNIQQSYPIPLIIITILLLSFLSFYFLKDKVKIVSTDPLPFRLRAAWGGLYFMLCLGSFYLIPDDAKDFSNNNYVNELAGNGLYELFSAYRHNELDYDRFYAKINIEDAYKIVRKGLQTPEVTFTTNNPENLERIVSNSGEENHLNVVLISVESLSASFMGAFGNQKNITPYLDSLAKQGMLFTNLYATGTRTVRGLEALSLSIPPTPGQSIVRRPDNENLFTLGYVFDQKGYESKYIYGGYGYFDNMNYFFANNGYLVVDRVELDETEIDYENIWGVADENLFTLAEREIEKTISQGKP